MQFSNLRKFDKELNKLLKKYRTLKDDIEVLKRFLRVYPQGYPPGIVQVSGLGVVVEIYKVKHFRCKALKHKGSRSGIRIVYMYSQERQAIEFIEIYYKEKDDKPRDEQGLIYPKG